MTVNRWDKEEHKLHVKPPYPTSLLDLIDLNRALTLKPLNTFGINCNVDCTPDIISWHQWMICLMLLYLKGECPYPTVTCQNLWESFNSSLIFFLNIANMRQNMESTNFCLYWIPLHSENAIHLLWFIWSVQIVVYSSCIRVFWGMIARHLK